MQEHKVQGLCYYCDDKFVLGHKCANCHFLLLMVGELPDTDPSIEPANAPCPTWGFDAIHF